MKKLLIIFVLFFIPSIVQANTFQKITVDGITFQNVVYNIGSQDYKIHVAASDEITNIDALAKSKNSITGINGIFFCPADYSECKGKDYTINERFVVGEDLSFYDDTGDRGVFAWDATGLPFIHQTAKINPEKREDIYEGMGNFPILYADGKNQIEYYHDVGLYDKKMSTPMKRHFICANKEKTQIFFGSTSATSLDNLAPALFKLGCWDGINLDAGGSTQYLYNGRRLEYSSRNILDGFVIERIGLDVMSSEALVEKIQAQLSRKYAKLSPENTVQQYDEIIGALKNLRSTIYEENSQDTYDSTGGVNGYTIDISSLPLLTRVYLINTLERKLQVARDMKAKEISK